MTVLQAHREVEGILESQLSKDGIACAGKTSSAPTGPLSAWGMEWIERKECLL